MRVRVRVRVRVEVKVEVRMMALINSTFLHHLYQDSNALIIMIIPVPWARLGI